MIRPNIKKIVTIVLANVAVLILLFVVFEGGASLYFAYQDASREIDKEPFLAERLHTEHDPLLGWINKANVSIADMYGPNLFLKTNGQRFRNRDDFTAGVPKGRIRVICSGDSYTLGFGVDNDHTWCNLLEALDPRLQTVNMGQGGYGLGQIYLWYKRDAARLDHQVHVFAFIRADFWRMRLELFLGAPKPVLRMRNGKMAVENVPVTRLSFHRALKYLRGVNVVRLAGEVGAISLSGSEEGFAFDIDEATELVRSILDSLKELNDARNSRLLLVYLPEQPEYRDTRDDGLQQFLGREAEKRGFRFLNLVKELRRVPPDEVSKFYFQKDIKGFFGSKGHYTAAGNAFVAGKIHEALSGMDGLNAR